jgi:GTPase SAR1 family protein
MVILKKKFIIILYDYRCTQIKMYSWDNAQVVLVGNKCDLEEERVISAERGKRLADQLGIDSLFLFLLYVYIVKKEKCVFSCCSLNVWC